MLKIVLDAMGGDNAPLETVKGAVEALDIVESTIVLVGLEDVIEEELKKYTYDSKRIEIVNATEFITNEEKPIKAIRSKKDSSMVVAFNMLKEGTVDAFISAGSTGAIVTGGTLKVGRIKGIDRPALTIPFPTGNGVTVLTDAGANTECKPKNLMDFAIMGSIYAENVFDKVNPTVGLVNVGSEAGKGNSLVNGSYDLISASSLNFKGNVEARDIPLGTTDVVVCDGFTGNVILKLTEGVAKAFNNELKEVFGANLLTKLAAVPLLKGLKSFKKKMDYTEYGGAPLLGTKKPIIKAHGSSNSKAIRNAIRYAEKFAKNDVIHKIEEKIKE